MKERDQSLLSRMTDLPPSCHPDEGRIFLIKILNLKGFNLIAQHVIHYFRLFNLVAEAYVFTETGKIARFKAIPDARAPSPFQEK